MSIKPQTASVISATCETCGRELNASDSSTRLHGHYVCQKCTRRRIQICEQVRKALPKETRDEMRKGAKCAQCGSTDHLTIDHIIPIVKGGTNERSNLQVLCHSCNARKGVRP